MSSTSLEGLGFTVGDVQNALSAQLHPTILLVFGYGLHTCVFSISLYYTLCAADGLDRKRAAFACIITFLWVSQSALVILNWRHFVHDQFITHGESLYSELEYYSTSGNMTDPSNLAVVAIQGVNVIVADIVMIWRCWVLYERTWKITVPLTVGFLAELFSSATIITSVSKRSADYSEQTKWTFVYCLTTVLINGFCTLLIVLRLARSRSFLRTYGKIIEILVESALAYTIAYIALLIVYGYEFYTVRGLLLLFRFRYPWAKSNSITGIAPTLIIGRVMARKSRSESSSRGRLAPRIQGSAHPLGEPSLFIGASQQGGHTVTDIAFEVIYGDSEDGTDGDDHGGQDLGDMTSSEKRVQGMPFR